MTLFLTAKPAQTTSINVYTQTLRHHIFIKAIQRSIASF